jgi:hypothetical protein
MDVFIFVTHYSHSKIECCSLVVGSAEDSAGLRIVLCIDTILCVQSKVEILRTAMYVHGRFDS